MKNPTDSSETIQSQKPVGNVIDLLERRIQMDSARGGALRSRFDLERAKFTIATSLVSLVALVTLANNSIWRGPSVADSATNQRVIASISATGVSDSERGLAQRMAAEGLADGASVGRKATTLDQLALGFLEGKYSLSLHAGKLHGVEFNEAASSTELPKFVDRVNFIEQNRALLPVTFDRVSKGQSRAPGLETYELLRDGAKAPLGTVEFRMDDGGRMISMKVSLLPAA